MERKIQKESMSSLKDLRVGKIESSISKAGDSYTEQEVFVEL